MASEKLTVLKEPTLAEAVVAVEKAFQGRKTLIVAGDCHVHYAGRANSTLENGERLLIIKSDGSLLVHRPTGYEPRKLATIRLSISRGSQRRHA